MNTATAEPSTSEAFTVTRITVPRRMAFLPRHIRGNMKDALTFEFTVYDTMNRICEAYHGGYWEFFDVSNGAFFMVPNVHTAMDIEVDGNGFRGAMNPDAAGIVATLMALSALSCRRPENEHFAEGFHNLRDYVLTRDDREQILRAID